MAVCPSNTQKVTLLHNGEDIYSKKSSQGSSSKIKATRIKQRKPKPPACGVVKTFPMKLHLLLSCSEKEGFSDAISWHPHGRSFVIHKPKKFTQEVMPRYFKQTKFASFQRQLNLYNFLRINSGPDHGGYYNELFVRGRPELCKHISREPIKGMNSKVISYLTEPNFYAMDYCQPETVTPQIQNSAETILLNFLESWGDNLICQESASSDDIIDIMQQLEPTPIKEPVCVSSNQVIPTCHL